MDLFRYRGSLGVLATAVALFERPGVKVMKSSQIFTFAHLANGGLQSALHCLLYATSSSGSMTKFNSGGFLLTDKSNKISPLRSQNCCSLWGLSIVSSHFSCRIFPTVAFSNCAPLAQTQASLKSPAELVWTVWVGWSPF